MTDDLQQVETSKKWNWRRRFRIAILILLCLLLLFLFLILITQFKPVQQWGSQRIANYLSKQLNTEILVDGFRIKWTDEIELNHVLIRDLDRDTMIYVGSLEADLRKPIRGFIKGEVNIEGLTLSDAYLNIKFEKEDWYNNLNQVFNGTTQPFDSVATQVSPELKEAVNEKDRLFLLDDLVLNRVRVRNFHEIKGKEELFFIGKGKLKNVSFNPAKTILLTDELWLENPIVDITNFRFDDKRYYEVFVLPYQNDTTVYEDLFPITLTALKTYVFNGTLKLENLRKSPTKTTAADQLDWHHLDVAQIEIDGDSLYMNNWVFGGVLNSLKAQTSSGFNIVNASSSKIHVTEQLATLNNIVLESSMSTVRGNLKFIYDRYPDFRNFENDVRFDFNLNQSQVGIDDLMTFSPGLQKNPFFKDNFEELISIDGRILGYVNNLKGRSLTLKIGRKFEVNGLIDVRDFTDPNRTRINLDLQELSTDMITIRELVPNLKLPLQFDRLGNIKLTGEFNGLLKDFIAFGDIETDMGTAKFNMNLNFVGGITNAVYEGELDLNKFKLGAWSGNYDFGEVSFNSRISRGIGLTQESASGRLAADIRAFDFKGYTYHNAYFSGFLEDQLVNGNFLIVDDNIDLSWEGKIEIGKTPHVDVSGDLKHLDLKALKLLDKDLVVASGFNINIQDIDPDRFTGDITLEDVFIGGTKDEGTHIDSLNISSYYGLDSNKYFEASSDVVSAEVNGKFRILSLPNYFTNYFLEFNPKISNKLGLTRKDNLPYANFDFNMDLHDSRGLLSHITTEIDTLRNVHLEGYLRDGTGFFLNGYTPNISIGTATLSNFNFYANADGAYTNIVTSHDGMQLGKVRLSPLTVFADLEQDTILYVFNETDFQSYFDQINIEGKLYISEGFWQTQVYDSELQMFGEDWTINDNNYLRFSPEKLLVRNLNFSHEDEYIKIKSINDDRGLAMELQDLPLDRINGFMNYDRLNFSGLLSGSIRAMTLKSFDQISANLISPKVLINGDDFGEFTLTARSAGPNKPIFLDLNLIKDNQRLLGLAEVEVPNKAKSPKGSINAQLTIENYPASMIEYFIVNGLSNTQGFFHGSISAVGELSDPVIEGDINIPSSSFKIDILGTTYYLTDQHVHVNSDLIDASDVALQDKFGNEARVSGGITHHNLANLGFDARLQSDEILILETTKADNEIYYGTCFADVTANFGGTVQRPVILVEAENKPNSNFTINNDTDERSGGLDFIIFDFDTIKVDVVDTKVMTGVDLTIDMTVNRDVEVQIILDESTRDIIKGTGTGDLIFRYNPAGEMSLFGDYTIDQGEYLFTYSVGGLVPVNKPFSIRKGSKLQWTDDPFEADVDIRADYTVVAAPYNLIAGDRSDVLLEEAKQKTDVVLELLLRGPMLQPDISFNIELPELTGQLKNAVDVELSRIESDQTELQSQAASLIIFRDFARSDFTAGSSVGVVANTISEWLSNQVSYYLTGLVMEIVNDVGFIDDVQFDVGYRLPTGEYTTTGVVDPGFSGSEVGLSTKIIMFDRRLEATIKGDYINSTSVGAETPSSYFNADIEFDYILTKDRRWRLRAYTKQDQFYNDRRTRSGVGLTWRREYDDLEDYIEAIRNMSQKKENSGESK